MKKQEVIERTVNLIKRAAYQARVQEELCRLGFETDMMRYYKNVSNGRAFGTMRVLSMMTGKPANDIYEAAVEEAIQDIREVTNGNNRDNMITGLLDLAGFSGTVVDGKYHGVVTK